ncbi:MAG: phage major capsid protein [Rubrivivax sp.]|nr:MAG: phage major capsid protein [Rubrivivax sp.]
MHLGIHFGEPSSFLLLANGPAALDVKELVQRIEQGFADFKKTNDERLGKLEKGGVTGDMEAKLAAIQKDVATALDLRKDLERVELKAGRSGLGGGHDVDPDKVAYKTAFVGGFIRKGDETGLKDLATKAMSVGSPSDGGFAVPESLDRTIEKLQRDVSPMRQMANVVQVGTSEYKKLVNKNGIASGWVGETDGRPETGTSKLAEVAPPMGELYANPMVTQQALDDLFYDVEADIVEQVAEEFAVAEGGAFTSGNSVKKPQGFLTLPTAATKDNARAFGTLEHIATGQAGDFAANNKADLFYFILASLKAEYRTGALWTMNKQVMFEIMRIKNADGDYLWQPSLQESMPIKLLGFGVMENEDMPDKAANSLSIAFGNFKRGYTIVDRMGTRMLRDPYTNKPYVGFYTTKRVGGGVINSEAIKVAKFAAA